MTETYEAQKEALAGQDLAERSKEEGIPVDARFLQTLKNSTDAKDKALYASLMQHYDLVNGDQGYELVVKPSPELDSQLDRYEAAYLQRRAQMVVGVKPYEATITPEKTTLKFSSSIVPMVLEGSGDKWVINGQESLTFPNSEVALAAVRILSTALNQLGRGELGIPDSDNPFYSDMGVIYFSDDYLDTRVIQNNGGLAVGQLTACTNYLNKVYRDRKASASESKEKTQLMLTKELLDGGFTGTGIFPVGGDRIEGTWENGKPKDVVIVNKDNPELTVKVSFDKDGKGLAIYDSGNTWQGTWHPESYGFQWDKVDASNALVIKELETFASKKSLPKAYEAATLAASLKGKQVGTSVNLAPSLPTQSGYSLSASVQYDGRVQVILSGNPSAASTDKGRWKLYMQAVEYSLGSEAELNGRDLNATTRQQLGGTRVIEFGERRVEGALDGFITKNSLPKATTLLAKAQEFSTAETAKGDYNFEVYQNYQVTVAQRGKETLIYLSGKPDPDKTDRALWDQYRELVKASFSSFAGYSVKDDEGISSNGISAIRIPANSVAPAADVPTPAAPVPETTVVATSDGMEESSEREGSPIHNEMEFLSSLRGDGWKRLAQLSDNGDSGRVTVNIPNDKTNPDYLYSRIHHFLGKDEAVKELSKPENYAVTINGKAAEWKATDKYKEGTWVDPSTGKRVLVEGGTTTIEWKKKEAPAVADAPSPEPVPVAAPVLVAESEKVITDQEAIDSLVKEDGALRTEYLELKARDEALQQQSKVNRLAATFAPKKEAARLAKVQQDLAQLGSDYLDFQARLADVSPKVQGDAQAKSFLDSIQPYTDQRIAVLVPTEPAQPVMVDSEEAPAPTEPAPAPQPGEMAGENQGTKSVG